MVPPSTTHLAPPSSAPAPSLPAAAVIEAVAVGTELEAEEKATVRGTTLIRARLCRELRHTLRDSMRSQSDSAGPDSVTRSMGSGEVAASGSQIDRVGNDLLSYATSASNTS